MVHAHGKSGPARRVGLVIVVVALSLLGMELVARRRFPLRGFLYRIDSERIHTTQPGARRLQLMPPATGDPRVLVELNSLGLRGPELRVAERRMLVVGDSLVLGANVSRRFTFAVQLEERLAASGVDWEVLNAGAESYGPDQTLLQLEEQLPLLNPDEVVLVLCANNDFGDLHRNKLFGIESNGELKRQKIQLGKALLQLFDYRSRVSAQPALWRIARHWRRLRNASIPGGEDWIGLYLRAARFQYQDAVVQRSPVVDDVERDTYDADMSIHPEWPSSEHKRKLMTLVLARIASVCEAAEARLTVVVVPSAVDVAPNSVIQVEAERFPTYNPLALSSALSECALEAGIDTLDLTEMFLASDPATLFSSPEDFHWNARAQALAADLWVERMGGV